MFVRGWFDGLTSSEQNFVIAVALVVVGLLLGGLTARIIRRVLEAFDVNEAVEGTAFERTARGLGTSTVGLLSQLCGFFVFLVAALYAFEILRFLPSRRLLKAISLLLPRVFVAVLVLIVGVLLGDKAEIVVGERLRSIKLPEVTVLPATAALLVLLTAYSFGLFFLGGLAFKDLLSSAAAGIYLLLTEPYSIGDEVEIGGNRGIVQEVDVFVTRIENEGEEHVIPNRKVMTEGAMRVRG
ncbi:mechanosensitive ion channel protein MscS [Halobacteriales archaeon SW_5_68_122]|nr:MAG: mechanosensitive ion channel protein MscS [Halobacteriales archaeon SW_5_68_122]